VNIKFFSTIGYDFYGGGEGTETEYIPVPIYQPEMDQEEVGRVTMSIDGLYAPSINTNAITIGAPIMRVFSAPQNL
jgi:hypothetical protein